MPINEQTETVAIAFAQAFLDAHGDKRVRAALQLITALEDLTAPVDPVCKTKGCKHTLFWHEGLTGGMCLKPDCPCGMFSS